MDQGVTAESVSGSLGEKNARDEDVQVLSQEEAEREMRRKRRRRLYRLLNQRDTPPSFLAVLQVDPHRQKDGKDVIVIDEDDEVPPPVVVIDVDQYLGFEAQPPSISSSSGVAQPSPNRTRHLANTVTSSFPVSTTGNNASSINPADEGWYEGTCTMAMPEDSVFLSDLHVWIRHHLEFFSASDLDVQHSQAGRRTKTVRGKVGIRCIHCARNIIPKLEAGQKVSWPAGAVSYPLNFSGLYSGVSQKPQLHFEACPYLPKDSKLATMLQEARANQLGNAPLTGIGKRKRMVQGVSGLMYYIISCQRRGLQEVPNQGIRFARDLSLEPLEFDTMRHQVEREHPDLIPKQYQSKVPLPQRNFVVGSVPVGPDQVNSSSDVATPVLSPKVIVADAASNQVLLKALEEADNPQQRLIRTSDKSLITDYMFLAISQMAICHANQQDFLTRGKKTKMMRIGLAGFCCRHCQYQNSLFSCRSFSSAADNLASAISNSFVLHLQKCSFTPREIQMALTSLKRIHTKQMGQLPYGSQRKLFFMLWDRMRDADLPVASATNSDAGIDVEMTQISQQPEQEGPPSEEENSGKASDCQGKDEEKQLSTATNIDPNRPNSRGLNFPITSDEATQAVLKEAEESWGPIKNNDLILPEDRHLVSDYVFLTMRQLKVAMPTPADFRGNRRNNVVSRMAGMCCIHCADDPVSYTPSGRSFPSAPDNMASALNSSLYNHMQHCPHVPLTMKRAFQFLRKIHSLQCQSLAFGSQRRFFNKVYAKLKQIPLLDEQVAILDAPMKKQGSMKTKKSGPIFDKAIFREHSFVAAGVDGAPYWQCLKCRMVPFEFRAMGAIHYVRPSIQHLEQHLSICEKDGIYFGWFDAALEELRSEYKSDKLAEALEPLIGVLTGEHEVLKQVFRERISDGSQKSIETSGLWRQLPASVDFQRVQEIFEHSAEIMQLSSRSLHDHPKFCRLLELVSPCFVSSPTDPQPDCPGGVIEDSTRFRVSERSNGVEEASVAKSLEVDITAETFDESEQKISSSTDSQEAIQDKFD